MNEHFDFSQSAIIKPPDPNKHNDKKYTKIIIDSRDRNKDNYPTANDYVIELPEVLDDVICGEIFLMDIPFTSYLINDYNNNYTLDGEVLFLENGDYSKSSFVSVFEQSLNTNANNKVFTVTYDSIKDNFTIECNSPFNIRFDNYLAIIIGFEIHRDYNVNDNEILRSTYRSNWNPNKYIVLNIQYMSINHSANSNIHKSTAVVYKNEMGINTRSAHTTIKKYFNPIIPRLTKLHVKLYDYYGNPYDCQNHDHRIDIVLESRKHTFKYTY